MLVVECARSRETVKQGDVSRLLEALTDAADYGYFNANRFAPLSGGRISLDSFVSRALR